MKIFINLYKHFIKNVKRERWNLKIYFINFQVVKINQY